MLTPQQQKYIAWCLTRKRNSSDDDKFTSVLAEAQVDLNPHQIDAALFAFRSPLSMGAILADEVGLGKTIEAALVISQQWAQRNRKILIIAPATLRKQWSMELAEKFFLPSLILESKNYKQIISSEYRNPFDADSVVICSYQFAKKQIKDVERVDWDLVVIDEAHKLRNVYKSGNKTATVLKDGLKRFKKLLLTATPLQNNVKELFGLISIIDDNYFGSLKSFTDRYNKAGLRQDKMYNELRDRISPIIHRTLRTDVQEYVKYTERHPMVQEYYPSNDELALSELVTDYLQKEACYGMPPSQRSLISLVLHKLLSSSTFAIAGTLKTIIDRLKDILANDISGESQEDAIMNDIKDDIDDFEDYDEEWSDEENEEFEANEKSRTQYSQDDVEGIKAEISELTAIYELALGIAHNTKGECLLKALDIAFEDKRKNGQPEKALIFTESNRTQRYLKQLLEDAGYQGKIVLFNGSNTDPESKDIYNNWLEKNKGTSRITGSVSADKRQALVDYFKETAQIMIATEAASEGINLQFCSLLVNYDLPWNPQRVEQRIGRCHRYGQKNDVVVVNFINKANRADQRVYELLSQKFNLFCGVFGSSDEVLGSTMDGIDFERSVLNIYQSCRSVEEIDAAFDRLQEEMKDEIDQAIINTQNKLIENFDKDVVSKLKLRKSTDEYRLSEFYRLLWLLTISVLGGKVKVVDNQRYRFLLLDAPCIDGKMVDKGLYQMGKEVNDAYTYRIGHPLSQYVLEVAKHVDTSKDVAMTFDYSGQGDKISIIEAQKGKSGVLRVSLMRYTSPKDAEDHLVSTAIDAEGNELDDDFVVKLMSIPATSVPVPPVNIQSILPLEKKNIHALTEQINLRNKQFINEESIKIERWADDQTFLLEQELKDLKKQIKEKERAFRAEADDNKRLSLQKEIQSIQKLQRQKRQELFVVEDEIIEQRDKLIEQLDSSLATTVKQEVLFTIHWTIK